MKMKKNIVVLVGIFAILTGVPTVRGIKHIGKWSYHVPIDSEQNSPFSRLHVRNLGRLVNSHPGQSGPVVNGDGRTMLFVSKDREGGLGSEDLWVTTRTEDNDTDWSQPVNISALNSSGREASICIASDDQTVYFSSNRNTSNEGDLNIWAATQTGRNWTDIHELGAPVNTRTYGYRLDSACRSASTD